MKAPTKRIEELVSPVVNGVVTAYLGPISDLPARFANRYEKRRSENLSGKAAQGKKQVAVTQLPPHEADLEARAYVAQLIFKEVSRKREKASQMPLFQMKGSTSMTPEKVGGGR
jgi:hypothetical protein